MEEGRKVFKTYLADLEGLFLSCCEVMRQGTVLRDTTPIVFNKPEVTPEVRPDPSPSRNDIKSIINSALKRQAKSTDKLLRWLIEERDGEKHSDANVNPSSSTGVVNFTQTNPHTSGPSTGDTTMPNPSAQPMNHFHSRTAIEGLAPNLGISQQTMVNMYGQGYTHTAHSFTIPNPSSTPIPSGLMVEHTLTLATTSKPRTLP
jgi:hypothetical protein